MGKIYKLSDKNGNVLYPMTIGDAIAVDGTTLSKKITTDASWNFRGMMSADDKKKLDGIARGATANKGTVTSVAIKAGAGIDVNDQNPITTSGERTISLAAISGLSAGTYKSVNVDVYGRVTSGSNPTTLAGYGIQDASIYDNNTIHLGGKSITPLTDGSNYVTLNGNQALINKTYNGYTLADACKKAVDEATMNPSSTNLPTSKAVANYVGGALDTALVSVLKYKGTVTSTSGLPATHKVGYVYVVAEAGTYAGQKCEVGDYIICKTDGTTANNAHWDVINGENQVSNKDTSLNWNTTSTIATVDGTDITVKMPSNPVTVSNGNPTLSWGTKSKVATVSGADIHVTMPDNPAANKQDKIKINGILKGDGNGNISAANAGTDYLLPVSSVTAPNFNGTDSSTCIINSVTQTKNGQISVKKSTFTIAKSVPADASFTDTTYEVVNASKNGLMSPAMLNKLNSLDGTTLIVTTQVTNTEYTDSLIESIIKGA